MENHDEAYRVWRNAGVKQRVLIHIDAHHDMWWIQENTPTTIANFICPSLKENMVCEVFWVVPDQTWELSRSRKALLRYLREIVKKYPESRRANQVGNKRISTVIMGKRLTICSADGLPSIDENVLLDIDVDYLVIPYVSYGEADAHGALPWRWPDELLSRLGDRGIRSDIRTISYSVDGGYTPLRWKYLGNELAARLSEANPTAPLLQGMRLVREGAVAVYFRDLKTAEKKYREATEVFPDFSASHYHLAHLYAEMNRIAEAREHYGRAIALDPSYKTAFDTAGLLYQSMGRFKKVEQEIRRALRLDPKDAYAHYGLGRIAAQSKQWPQAELQLTEALALEPKLIDAHRALGDILAKQRRADEAINAYESSMKLALAGEKPLDGPILTNEGDDRRLQDPGHFRIHARLAHLHDLKGNRREAIGGYRMSIAGGYDRMAVRARLAHLYLKEGKWRQSAQEMWRAIVSLPREAKRGFFRLYWRIHRMIRNAWRPPVGPKPLPV